MQNKFITHRLNLRPLNPQLEDLLKQLYLPVQPLQNAMWSDETMSINSTRTGKMGQEWYIKSPLRTQCPTFLFNFRDCA